MMHNRHILHHYQKKQKGAVQLSCCDSPFVYRLNNDYFHTGSAGPPHEPVLRRIQS